MHRDARRYTPDVLFGVFAVAFFAWLALRTPGTPGTVLVDRLAFLVPGLAVAFASWQAARLPGLDARTRAAWALYAAAALALWATGAVWAGASTFWPGIFTESGTTWGSLTFYAFELAAFWTFPRDHLREPDRLRALVDFGLTAIAGGVLVFQFELRAFIVQPSLLGYGIVASVCDWAAFVSSAMLYMRTAAPRRRQVFVLLVLSTLLSLVADYFYGQQPSYVDGDWVDGLFMAVWVAKWSAVRAFVHHHATEAAADEPPSRYPNSWLPYLVVGLGFLMLLSQMAGYDADSLLLAASAAVMSALLIGRHIIELRESGRLFEAQLAQERRFRSLVQNSSDVTVLVDADEALTFVSPSVEAVLGAESPLRVGARFRDAVTLDVPDDAARIVSPAPGQANSAIGEVRAADGRVRRVEIASRNLRADPTVGAVVLHIRDVTERTELEQQLRHAQKLEALGLLAGGLAHDFNNVLAVIRGYTELLKLDLAPGSTPRREILLLDQAVDRAAAVTRKLLAFSRKQSVQPVVVDLNRVLVELQPMLRQLLPSRTQVELRCAEDLWHVKVDPGQVEQVVLNLAANARDAMPDGGVLRLTTMNRPGAGETVDVVELEVSDEGSGMTEEVRSRIFEPFFTTKPRDQGSGLGLAMVYGIVSQAGGEISVRSAPGQGTTFTLSFPRTLEAPRMGLAPAARDEAAPKASGTVLVVEDEVGVRRFTRRILAHRGFTVLEADCGARALEVARDQDTRIDILLTDLVMPGMDGRTLIAAFHLLRPDVPIVCMTGFADGSGDQRSLGPGVVALLAKPFTAEVLVRALTDAAGRGHPLVPRTAC